MCHNNILNRIASSLVRILLALMQLRLLFPSLLLWIIGSLSTATHAQQAINSKQPNIIFILADDLGYGNLTCYNAKSRVATPNIDRMAREGTRYTRFYAGSTVCAPSRAALMTGLHMGHAYVRGNGDVSLRAQDTTVAQRLQANGYVTGMFGKWGLGREDDAGAPQLKGFDEFFGYLNQRHAHHYFTDRLWEVRKGQIRKVATDTTQYTHDLLMDRAFAFIHANRQKPFFLYLPVTIPHAELQIPEKYMQPFLNADGSSKLPPEKPFIQNKTSYHSQKQPHAAFAAMLTKLDGDVGRLFDLLKRLGLDENTYVFFTSDNGPHQEGGGDPAFFNSSGPLRGVKRDLYEGGIRVPMIVRAPGNVLAGHNSEQVWASWDILPTLSELTNTPVQATMDGVSFAPALTGRPQPKQHEYLYWQFNESILKEAVVQGNWKLIRLKEKGKPEVLELYDLTKDIGEKQNLASSHSERVKALRALMLQSKTPAENSLFDWSAMEQ